MTKILRGPLADKMIACGITPQTLAQKLGVKVRAIHRIFEGKTGKLPGTKLSAMAAALQISRAELCTLLALQRDVAAPAIALNIAVRELTFLLRYRRPDTIRGAEPWASSKDEILRLIESLNEHVETCYATPAEAPAPKKIRPLSLLKLKKKNALKSKLKKGEFKSQSP